MKNPQEQLEALSEIRQMMKQSNRFLSLSGLSGVFAGVYALAGAYYGSDMIDAYYNRSASKFLAGPSISEWQLLKQISIICCVVLCLSLATAWFFSSKKARKQGTKLFDQSAKRLFINMAIPLATGGLFCIALLSNGFAMAGLVSPAMLIFYGLALVNGSKYTLHEIRYLGCLEIVLGIIASFFMNYGLLLWALGFGILHIVYGAYMWLKYDKNA